MSVNDDDYSCLAFVIQKTYWYKRQYLDNGMNAMLWELNTVKHAVVVGALLKIFLYNFCSCEYIFIGKTGCMKTAIDIFMIFNF